MTHAPIKISNISTLKKALSTDGIVVVMDYHLPAAPRLQRNPEQLARMSKPRTVQVRSKDIIFQDPDDETSKSYLDIPKAANIACSNSNTFSLLDNGTRVIDYRIEYADTNFAPSRLAENHPPLSADILNEEAKERRAQEEKVQENIAAQKAAWERISNLGEPAENPEYAPLLSAMKQSVEKHTGNGPISNEQLNDIVRTETRNEDYGVIRQIEDYAMVESPGMTLPLHEKNACWHLAAYPRGTWQIIRQEGDFVNACISTGGPTPACRRQFTMNAENNIKTPEEIGAYLFESMQQSETYEIRRKVDIERRKNEADAIISRYNFTVGKILRNLKLNGKTFGSAEITDISEKNTVSLLLRLKTGRKTYTTNISMVYLAEILDASKAKLQLV